MKTLFLIFMLSVTYFPIYPAVSRNIPFPNIEEEMSERIKRRLAKKANGTKRWK